MKDDNQAQRGNRPCSRRLFLKLTGAAAGFFLAGCGDDNKAVPFINPVSSPSGTEPPPPTAIGSRVVDVKDEKVTTWDGKQTWYGSDTFVNQARLDAMVKEGVLALAGRQTEAEAWQVILPGYGRGKRISVKINLNNAASGGNVIDPLPQLLKSPVKGLKAGGIDEQDIWFLEPSRPIVDRVAKPVKTAYPGVRLYGAAKTDYSEVCTFRSSDPGLIVKHGGPGIEASKLPDQLGASAYLIHLPIMKAHGMAGVTLTYKNLFGLFESSTIPKFHGSFFNEKNNPMVEIFSNGNVGGKTALVLADGIYGNWVNNHSEPTRWKNAFPDGLWPKRIFLARDPVAVDCVQYDFLNWEKKNLDGRDETYLVQAAGAKQGKRDHWNNPRDKKYALIDFVQRDLNAG